MPCIEISVKDRVKIAAERPFVSAKIFAKRPSAVVISGQSHDALDQTRYLMPLVRYVVF